MATRDFSGKDTNCYLKVAARGCVSQQEPRKWELTRAKRAGAESPRSGRLLNNTACVDVSLVHVHLLLPSKSCGDSYAFVEHFRTGAKIVMNS